MTNSTNTTQPRRVNETIDPYQGAIAALEYFGISHDGRRFTCPQCGSGPEKKKTTIRHDGGITCHKCGNSISTGNMWGTVQRLSELAGRGTLEKGEMLSILRGVDPDGERGRFITNFAPAPEPEPETFVDSEVLEALCDLADVDAGVAYWQKFHIDPRVAKAFGALRLVKPWGGSWQSLVDRFGVERLISAGLAKELEDGSLWTVPGGKLEARKARFAPDYPVLQVYRTADGKPVGLEVRGGEFIEDRVKRYNEYKAAYGAWESGGKVGEEPAKVRWIPKTRNLVGNAKGSRVGFGLDVVAKFPTSKVVWLVEGYKDALAAGTLGRPAIGIAGAKAGISPEGLEVLKGRRVAIAFDSDEAGEEGAAMLEAKLTEAGVELVKGPVWPDGRDVADQLADMHRVGKLACKPPCGQQETTEGRK